MTLLEHSRPTTRVEPQLPGSMLTRATWITAALATLAWIPFLRTAAGPDEGGFLLVASQWAHGSSLYGDYWVDRPPLLIVIHALAAATGGTMSLRVLGIVAVVSSIVLAAAITRQSIIGRLARPSAAALVAPVVIAGVFLSSPLFGATHVGGELLSVPFVLAGVSLVLRSFGASGRARSSTWAAAAGVASVSAVAIKQNAVDVVVVTAVLLVLRFWSGRRRQALRTGACFAGGAITALGLLLGLAAGRGTRPGGLWDAVVTFRFQAATVIHHSASAATHARMLALVGAAFLSVAPFLVAVLAIQVSRRPAAVRPGDTAAPDLRWPALVLLAWEVVSIIGGASYWLHYLIVLVPGMVLLAAAAAQRPVSLRIPGALLTSLAIASACVTTVSAAHAERGSTSDARVSAYVRSHAAPGDSMVVAFGHPNILWDAGLSSPYPQIWSLPVRVRDSRLVEFQAVLAGPTAPTWVVVSGESLYTWGVDSTSAEQVLRSRYAPVAHLGHYFVWRHR
ncbi:hypothetical protein [Marmoricola sp. RAF53]|uniref:hypothetical protein n=1 Tax=Marmoricola sp. RAF53 TaxID=3233059 RepID=UPI003F991167